MGRNALLKNEGDGRFRDVTLDLGLTEEAWSTSAAFLDHDADQTDPVLSGDRLVWADDRTGDQDLWMADLAAGTSGLLYTAAGDQDAPSLDGTTLVFVSRHPSASREPIMM